MPKRRVLMYTSSEEEDDNTKSSKKSNKIKPKKKVVPRKRKEIVKRARSSSEWSETDSENESDLSFVVSDSSSEDEYKKKVMKTSSKSTKNTSKTLKKFATKSAQLSSIIGKKNDPITTFKFQTTLTKSLYRFYNQEIFKLQLPANLSIKWNERLISAAGRCMYEPKLSIELSPKIIKTDRYKLRDILLHEMVHAVAFLTNKEYGHGQTFYEIANQVERLLPKIPRVERCHNFKIDYKFTFYCVDCGMKYNRQKRTINVNLDTCGECRGKLKMKQNR